MGLMPDLTNALHSFSQVFADGSLDSQKGKIDPKIFVHIDQPNGQMRLTYGMAEGKKVTAMIVFVQAEPVEGLPCFSIGWAVPEEMQSQGRATRALSLQWLNCVKVLRVTTSRRSMSRQ